MKILTKTIKDAASTILLAAGLDTSAGNLEIVCKNNKLFLNVGTQEYYVSLAYDIEDTTEFRAVVDATLFLNLISGITAIDIDLSISGNTIKVKAGKSNYTLALIYENDKLITLPVIKLGNKTVEMNINNDILQSILNTNSKELLKVKNKDIRELQKLYYFSDGGCFTFTTGATLNTFSLDKPIKVLLTDRIVKLFKLFKDTVYFSYGFDILSNNSIQKKVVFETPTVYVAALVPADDQLLKDMQGPCDITKNYMADSYTNHLVVSANDFLSAVQRLLLFAKNINGSSDLRYVPAKVFFTDTEMHLKDNLENEEVISLENDSHVDTSYTMTINMADFKLILESCKLEHITINCGNHKSIIITHGLIRHLLPESIQ